MWICPLVKRIAGSAWKFREHAKSQLGRNFTQEAASTCFGLPECFRRLPVNTQRKRGQGQACGRNLPAVSACLVDENEEDCVCTHLHHTNQPQCHQQQGSGLSHGVQEETLTRSRDKLLSCSLHADVTRGRGLLQRFSGLVGHQWCERGALSCSASTAGSRHVRSRLQAPAHRARWLSESVLVLWFGPMSSQLPSSASPLRTVRCAVEPQLLQSTSPNS